MPHHPTTSEETTYLLGCDRVFGDSPSVAEAIGQFEDGQHKFSFSRATLFKSSLQSELFDLGGVRSSGGKVVHGRGSVGSASPSMSRTVVSLGSSITGPRYDFVATLRTTGSKHTRGHPHSTVTKMHDTDHD